MVNFFFFKGHKKVICFLKTDYKLKFKPMLQIFKILFFYLLKGACHVR